MEMSTDPKALEMELDALPEGAVVTDRSTHDERPRAWTKRGTGRWVGPSGISRSSGVLAERYAPLEYDRDASPQPVWVSEPEPEPDLPPATQPGLPPGTPMTAADLCAAHLGRVVEFTVPPEPVRASGLAVHRDEPLLPTPTTVKGVLHALEVGHTPPRATIHDSAARTGGDMGPAWPWVFVNVLGVLPSYAHNRLDMYLDSASEDTDATRRAAMFQLPTHLPVTLHD